MAITTIARYVCSLTLFSLATTALAQTCASPITLAAPGTVTGTTCAGSIELQTLVNGAMNGGQQIVYRMPVTPNFAPYLTVSLQPEAGVDMALFVCSNTCSSVTSCIAAVDDFGAGATESKQITNPAGDFYLIVQTAEGTAPSCGGYALNLAVPL